MQKLLTVFFLLLAFNIGAEELTPLLIYIKKHPAYLTNSTDVEYIANRCGSLMTILANRTREAGSSKEIIKLADHYTSIGNTYSSAGLLLSKAPKSSEKKYIETHKMFLNNYANLILQNWKKGNVFRGLVEEDFTTCAAHESFYQKLASNLK
jgi:hypothetical protein